MTNYLIFGFMTLWIWGWILFVPIFLVRSNVLKGWLISVVFVLSLVSFLFDLQFFGTGFDKQTILDAIHAFFGSGGLVIWIPVFVSLLYTFVDTMSSLDEKEKDLGEEVLNSILSLLVVACILTALSFFIVFTMSGLIIPLVSSLF